MVNHSMIGQILQSFGRITEKDIEEALEYQKRHGGYFGEALLALDLVTREELDWGLASQFDIPYVFPDPDTIDPEVAGLVTADWALTNLTLPILRSGDSLTVIVDSPTWSDAVEELQRMTDLRIELGLASPAKIRELIRHVYDRPKEPRSSSPEHRPITLEDLFAAASSAGASRFGISVRNARAQGWYEAGGGVQREPLSTGWRVEFERAVTPGPDAALGGAEFGEWEAELHRGGSVVDLRARFMGGPDSEEFVFEPVERHQEAGGRFDRPSRSMLSEIRMLVESGSARFLVNVDPPELGSELMPHLPGLLLERELRSVFLSDREVTTPPGVLVRSAPSDPERLIDMVDALRDFHFDAVAADLTRPASEWLGAVLDAAQTAFVLRRRDEDAGVAHAAGIRWELRVRRTAGDRLEWQLLPLQV